MVRERKFITKKLINLSWVDVSALNQISRKRNMNHSEIIRQGISLMKSRIKRSPKGVSVMK